MTTPLGALLGRVARPAEESVFDEVRLALVDALVTAKAENRLDHATWQEAFGRAMRSLRLRVLAEAEAELRRAAARSRYPARRLRAVLPDADSADAFLQRLLAAGMPLERFEGFADDPVTRRARAAALETSWDAALVVADGERARWRSLAAGIAVWRRPVGALWGLSAAIVAVAVLLGSWLSGLVRSPHWFKPFNDLWWRLWP